MDYNAVTTDKVHFNGSVYTVGKQNSWRQQLL